MITVDNTLEKSQVDPETISILANILSANETNQTATFRWLRKHSIIHSPNTLQDKIENLIKLGLIEDQAKQRKRGQKARYAITDKGFKIHFPMMLRIIDERIREVQQLTDWLLSEPTKLEEKADFNKKRRDKYLEDKYLEEVRASLSVLSTKELTSLWKDQSDYPLRNGLKNMHKITLGF